MARLLTYASALFALHTACASDKHDAGGPDTGDGSDSSWEPIPPDLDDPTPPTLSIVDYGATPDDMTDDTKAIVDCNNAAKAAGKAIYIPAGTFRIKGMTLTTSIYGAGMESAILYAYDAANPSIWIKGNNITLKNFQKKSAETTRSGTRWGFRLDFVDGFTIDRVFMNGGSGLFMYGAKNGKIIRNKLLDTVADSIHNTHNSSNIIVANNYVRGAGDDSIAVVNYGTQHGSNFLIQDNDLGEQKYARGITVAGASDITIQRNTMVRGHRAAGVNFEAGGRYQTGPGVNVIVRDNVITDYPLIAGSGHPAILLWIGAGGKNHERILIKNNTVTRGINEVGVRVDGAKDVAIVDNSFDDIDTLVARPRATNVYCAGNTKDGAPSDPGCGGSFNFAVTGTTLTY
jgi:hypothetical protein